ncbi:MAG: hypothetical protein Q7U47_14850 [Paludibacter sp.]|nr:hypothetical protein [Paludibacter sp.]
MIGNKEHQPLTSGIKHKGFSGYSSVVARFNFSCNYDRKVARNVATSHSLGR